MSKIASEGMNLNDKESQQQGVLYTVTAQQNYERNRNEELKKDIEKEKDCEYEKKVITLHIEIFFNKEWSDAKSAHETVKVINKIAQNWMKVDEIFNLFDKKCKKMGLDENVPMVLDLQEITRKIIRKLRCL